jgi:hypothetical protein
MADERAPSVASAIAAALAERQPGVEGRARAMFSTDDISHIVAAFVATRAGLARPVLHECKWMWSPGVGPVCEIVVESVPKVVSLDARRKGKGPGGKQRG